MIRKNPVTILFFGVFISLVSISFTLNNSDEEKLQNLLISHHEQQLPFKKNSAFREGEELQYRLHYGLIDAGEAILQVKPELMEFGGRKVYHIVGRGYTTGSTDWFFKVRDRYETYLDKEALLPWYFVRRVDEGGMQFSQDYVFDHYANKVNIGNNQNFDVPIGIHDMVSAFYAARSLDLSKAQPGDIFSLSCFMDKEIWPLKIKFIKREILKTDVGKIRSLVFRPVVQKGRVFKQEDDLTIWISEDNNHIPLRVEAKILIGSIKMDLKSYKNIATGLSLVSN